MVRRPLRTLVVIVCLLFFPPATRSLVTDQNPEKLRVAYTVIAPTQANVWVAKELGFYAKYGLDVDLVLLVGAPLAVAALVAGETPISHTGASASTMPMWPVPSSFSRCWWPPGCVPRRAC